MGKVHGLMVAGPVSKLILARYCGPETDKAREHLTTHRRDVVPPVPNSLIDFHTGDAPALATLALLAQNGKGAQTVESAPCGALRESGGSVRCRSCRRHNVKKRKADAAIAARLGAAGEAPVNPSPTARHITGGSQQGAYFPSGPVWKSTSELGYVASMAWGA